MSKLGASGDGIMGSPNSESLFSLDGSTWPNVDGSILVSTSKSISLEYMTMKRKPIKYLPVHGVHLGSCGHQFHDTTYLKSFRFLPLSILFPAKMEHRFNFSSISSYLPRPFIFKSTTLGQGWICAKSRNNTVEVWLSVPPCHPAPKEWITSWVHWFSLEPLILFFLPLFNPSGSTPCSCRQQLLSETSGKVHGSSQSSMEPIHLSLNCLCFAGSKNWR